MKKPVSEKRNTQFKVILIALPIVILIVLELGFRVFGYGDKTKVFFRPKYLRTLYLENLAVYNNYQDKNHQVESVRTEDHIRNLMTYEKAEGSIRGFIVGGSAAQGFPYNSNMSFGKMIEAALRRTGKYTNVEILNFGVSAISSYSVRDISKKLLAYDPDFLIVYAGNNEYYGTFSISTGGNHFTRNLYMQLKELGLMQAVKDLVWSFGKSSQNTEGKANLMENRFNELTFAKNKPVDQEVATNYTDNVKAVIKQYHRKNIPVILASPVSNILDLAPFGSENNEEVSQYAEKIFSQIKKNNLDVAQDAIDVFTEKREIENNANLMYLNAALEEAKTGKPDLVKYRAAKNHDLIPFRPREELTETLDSFCTSTNHPFENLHFIRTDQVLTRQYGDTILGNDIFLDHVHFNQFGHKVMAGVFTQKIADLFGFTPAERDTVQWFFNNDSLVYQSVYSLPMYRLFANKVVNKLTNQPPFLGMSIPYSPDPKEMSRAIDNMGVELAEKTLPMDMDDSFANTVVYYMNQGNYDLAHQYFLAGRFMFPGTYHNHLNLGRFYQRTGQYVQEAEDAYIKAYLLSEKKRDIYNEIKKFYVQHKMREKSLAFDEKFGRPKKK